MPVDAVPVEPSSEPDEVLFYLVDEGDSWLIAEVFNPNFPPDPEGTGEEVDLYMSHFASCPSADSWRA